MPAISPRLGEFLVKATKARDIDDAFTRVFSEYLTMKIMKLVSISEGFKKKWCMDFDEFKDSLNADSLKEGSYAFDTERDFWEWEEAETLKNHYEAFQKQWM